MAVGDFVETQSKTGSLHSKDSNRGPKDSGTRPAEMPEQPHVGTLCKHEGNPGVSRGGSLPEPITARGMTKSRG